MQRLVVALVALLAFASESALAANTWTEGRNYATLRVTQPTTVPAGKVEVLEVFSYGCTACNGFQPIMDKMKASLPANAQMAYLHASFSPGESWPMFQRAYLAAQALGIADRTHQAIFDAVWKTNELGIVDPRTGRLKTVQPTIEDAARCYARLTGVKPEVFLATARSFSVETKMKASDLQVKAMQIPSTPCIVVNGKYRVNMQSLSSVDDFIDIVRFLVAKETARAR